MDEINCFVSDWWLVAAIVLLACYGLGALAGEASNGFRKWLRGERPKPRQYRIVVEDHDGWPLRSYRLPAEAAGRLVRDLERDKPT
jgi:hypothetical protein